MRALVSLLSFLLLALPLAVVAAIFVLVQDKPLLERAAEFTPQHVERAKAVFRRHDPRKAGDGEARTLEVSAEELDLAVNYLVNRFGAGSASATLEDGAVALRASIRLPENPLGEFLNVQGRLREEAGRMIPEGWAIGGLPLPDALARWLIEEGPGFLSFSEELRSFAAVISKVGLSEQGLRVDYTWDDSLMERLRNVALPADERMLLQHYQTRLARITKASAARMLPLESVLREMMEGEGRGQPLVREYRAMLTVMAFHVGRRSLGTLLPEAESWPRPRRVVLTLGGREDLAQHFVISAAMASLAGSPLADAVGVYKELSDARVGSGFSFQDLAADRAGTLFGERASQSEASAAMLRTRLRSGGYPLLPALGSLPEFMSEAEFKRRFGGVGEPEYNRVLANIDRQLAVHPLYVD